MSSWGSLSLTGPKKASKRTVLHNRLNTWWLIPLSKWVITPVINGISRVSPLITGVITHLLSGMSHQVRKKLLVDVANLAPCCHDDYGVLLEVLGTLGKCYVSNPVAKTLVWIENHDWHNCFLHVFLGLTLTGPKKASKRTVLHNRLNKEKTPGRCCQSGSLLPWWLWCTIGGFGNPGQMLC